MLDDHPFVKAASIAIMLPSPLPFPFHLQVTTSSSKRLYNLMLMGRVVNGTRRQQWSWFCVDVTQGWAPGIQQWSIVSRDKVVEGMQGEHMFSSALMASKFRETAYASRKLSIRTI
jgi:hypothetical protein